jgi:hypothetical protein
LLPVTASAGGMPDMTYRHPVHKFSIKTFRDWSQVPLQAGEQVEVAKFYDPSARSYRIRPELVVVRVRKALSQTGKDSKEAEIESAYDVTLGRRGEDPELPAEESFKSIKSKDKVEGRLWTFERPRYEGADKDSTEFGMLVAYDDGVIEYGIFMTCALRQKGALERAYLAIGKSFRFFDKKAKDVKRLDVLDGVNIDDDRRQEIESSLVSGWAVLVSPKKNYIVVYNTKGNKNHELAKIIASRIELIRQQIYEEQFPPTRSIGAVSIVRVCGDQREYFAYGGMPGSAGYWNSGSEELVFYDASPSKKLDDDTIAVLYHEAFHQYIFYSVGEVSPHSWFNEGHGDYYAGARLKGRKFRIEPFDWRVQTVKNAIRKGSRRDVQGGYTPLKDLVRFSQKEYYAYASICYAQGWSLVYFLREVVPKRKSYRQKWGHILDVYFDTLKEKVEEERQAEEERRKREEEEQGEEGEGGDQEDPDKEGDRPDEDGEDEEPLEPGEEELDPEKENPEEAPEQDLEKEQQSAVEAALEKAFAGVDIEELEKAWIEATLKV